MASGWNGAREKQIPRVARDDKAERREDGGARGKEEARAKRQEARAERQERSRSPHCAARRATFGPSNPQYLLTVGK